MPSMLLPCIACIRGLSPGNAAGPYSMTMRSTISDELNPHVGHVDGIKDCIDKSDGSNSGRILLLIDTCQSSVPGWR